jgi:hypothetical protein
MATTASSGAAQKLAGAPALGPAALRAPRRVGTGRLLVLSLVALLLSLEAVVFQLSRSEGSPSWQAGWKVGVHLGAKAHRADGRRAAAFPAGKTCLPTESQQSRGIKTRNIEVTAQELDAGDFESGCIAGYRVTVERLKGQR